MSFSNGSTTQTYLDDPDWHGFQVFTVCCFLVANYIFAALVRYEVIHGKFNGPYMKPSFLMKITAMLSSLCLIFATTTTQMDLLITHGIFSGKLSVCKTISRVHEVFFNLGIELTYIFLWLRQFMFYRKIGIRHLNCTTVRVISSATLTLILVKIIVCVFINHYKDNVSWSEYSGCTLREKSSFFQFFVIMTLVVTLFTTLTLFGLFLYPLAVFSGRQSNNPKNFDHEERKAIKLLIRISIASVIVCILSDFLIPVLGNIFIQNEVSLFRVATFNDLSLLINIVSIILTYEKSRDILFGGCCRPDLPY